MVQVYSPRVFTWGSSIDYNRGEHEGSREEYDVSVAFDHFIEFAWKSQLKKKIEVSYRDQRVFILAHV